MTSEQNVYKLSMLLQQKVKIPDINKQYPRMAYKTKLDYHNTEGVINTQQALL